MRINQVERVNEMNNEQSKSKADKKNISWIRGHFSWILPSNLGRSRFSYAKKLKLAITDDDEKEVIFKPWLHRKEKHEKFIDIYSNLRKGISWHENKSFCCCLQILLQCMVFILLSPFLIILMLSMYGLAITTEVIPPFIISCFSSNFEDSQISILDKENGIKITTKPSKIQSNRFAVYRLVSYIQWITIHWFRVLSRMIVGLQRVPLIKDDQLIVYMHTNQHLKFEYDDNGNIIGGFIDNYDVIKASEDQLFPGRYFPIKKVYLDYKTNILSFTINNGDNKKDKIISNKPGDCSDKVWNAIKASYMQQRCVMDTMTHSWVHFHFNDIAIKYMYKYFGANPSSVLGRIIHSHFLYTTSLNTAGQSDSFNRPHIKGEPDSFMNTLNPIKINPVKREGFMSALFMRARKHYFKENEDENKNDECGEFELDRDIFPPRFIKDRLEIFNKDYNKIRGYSLYCDMLSEYYLSLYLFINKLYQNDLIEMEDLRGFIKLIDNDGMDGLSQCDELHVLSTLIWTNGFIHGTDHITFGNIFKNFPFYGCYNKLDGISEDNQDIDISHEEILNSWKSMWISSKSEIWIYSFGAPQSSCCIADYSSSPYLYRKFKNIPSLQINDKLDKINNIHNEYLHSLYIVNDKYEWMIHVNEMDASIAY